MPNTKEKGLGSPYVKGPRNFGGEEALWWQCEAPLLTRIECHQIEAFLQHFITELK